MKNIQFLLLSLIVFMNIINADVNLQTYKKDSLVNRLLQNGDNVYHMFAKECQTINSEEEAKKAMERFFRKYINNNEIKDINIDDANPFIRNKAGKTPRELSKETFKTTGSLNCKFILNKYREMEEGLVNELQIKMKTENQS